MGADFADGPRAPVAGMQAGMQAGTQAGYPTRCRQHPSASQMATVITRGHLPECHSAHEPVTTGESHVYLKSNPLGCPVLPAGCSSHSGARNTGFLSLPFL